MARAPAISSPVYSMESRMGCESRRFRTGSLYLGDGGKLSAKYVLTGPNFERQRDAGVMAFPTRTENVRMLVKGRPRCLVLSSTDGQPV